MTSTTAHTATATFVGVRDADAIDRWTFTGHDGDARLLFTAADAAAVADQVIAYVREVWAKDLGVDDSWIYTTVRVFDGPGVVIVDVEDNRADWSY